MPGGRVSSARLDVVLLGAVLALGAAVRVALIAADHGVTLDSDEAIIGLMGRHILEQGARPVFFYGQQYMGAFEAYAAAAAFAIAGPSTHALKGVMVVLDLLMVCSFVVLGRTLVDRRAGLLAGLYAALPPAFLAIYGLKARGGYVETVTIGNILLAGAARVGTLDEARCRWAALGLGILAGFGFWTHTLVALYFPAVAIAWLMRTARSRWFVTLGLAAAGAIVGGLPFWWQNVTSGFGSFGNVHWVGPATALRQLGGLLRDALPVVIGARGIWAFEESWPGLTALLASANVLFFAGAIAGAPRSERPGDTRACIGLVWLTALVATFVDAASGYGAETREPRYLFPIYSALALTFGVAVASWWRVGDRRRATAGACVLLAGHALGIVRQDPTLMLGISAGARVARSNVHLIEVLEKLKIQSVYTDYWVSYRLVFESGERIRARPFGHVVVERIPEMSAAVDADPNPAFVLLGDAATGFRAALSRSGRAFKEREVAPYRVFYRIEGVDEVRRWTYPFEGSARAQRGEASASVTLVPPKPSEFEIAKSTVAGRAAFGT